MKKHVIVLMVRLVICKPENVFVRRDGLDLNADKETVLTILLVKIVKIYVNVIKTILLYAIPGLVFATANRLVMIYFLLKL